MSQNAVHNVTGTRRKNVGRGVLQVGTPGFHLHSILHVEYLSLSTSVDRGAGGVANEDPCCVITLRELSTSL